jgi:hypothetical protein
MTANWPMPAGTAGSRRTAARVVCGAIYLSSAGHLPHKLYSNIMKLVALPPGRDRLLTKPETNRIRNSREYDRHRTGCVQHRSHAIAASGEDDVGCKRDQFRSVSTYLGGIASGPAGVNVHVSALYPA